jgi:uncharacterized lipoprotein YmbA
MTSGRPITLPLALALSTLLAACVGGPPPKVYVLTPLPVSSDRPSRASSIGSPMIGVEQVVLPEYLDRPEIVIRDGAHRLDISPSERWAEQLQTNVTRVLAANLSHLLQTDTVFALPSRREREMTWQVLVDIGAFEQDADGRSVLSARWSVVDVGRRAELVREHAVYVEPIDGAGYDAVVAAMNRNLVQLSRDIAAALAKLPS